MAYTYQSDVENYLGRSMTDAEAALFPVLEKGVEDYIDTYCARTFEASKQPETSQTYDGGMPEIFFDIPLQTLTKIEYQDVNTGDKQTIDASEYVLFPYNSTPKTSVMRRVGVFPYGNFNIIVTGTFGDYLTVPDGIKLAATTLCANYLNMTDDLQSETVEGYARVMDKEWNPLVKRLLDNYKRVVL